MELSSIHFLFLFLPVFLTFYLISARRFRLPLVSAASVIFLVWGGGWRSLLWTGGLVLLGYLVGLVIVRDGKRQSNTWLWFGIGASLVLLSFFKFSVAYGLDGYLPDRVSGFIVGVAVPVGLSYVAFQTISYMVDVWRGLVPVERNFISFMACLLFFPKLISGPIPQYKSFSPQFQLLAPSFEDIAEGFRRLFAGFIKRALIANQLAPMVNAVFDLPTANVEPRFAWLGLIAYALQIFFDFSGYTDMAIGLGMMLGVRLPENFNFPYLAQSLGDFWRRWHITLGLWFREYVFYPLERHRFRWAGQQINIVIVFLLTGLWHGFKPTFLIWGLLYDVVLTLENLGLGRLLKRTWRPIRHIYVLTVVMVGWVFFRSSSLPFAFEFFRRLAGDTSGLTPLPFSQTNPMPFIDPSFVLALTMGILFSLPVSSVWRQIRAKVENRLEKTFFLFQVLEDGFLILLFVLGLAVSLSESFLPNIYAKF